MQCPVNHTKLKNPQRTDKDTMKLLKLEVNYATVSKCFIETNEIELEAREEEAPVLVVYYYSEYFPERVQRLHKLVILTRSHKVAKIIACFFVPAMFNYEEYIRLRKYLRDVVSIEDLFALLRRKISHFRSIMHIDKTPHVERAYLILFPPP